MHINSTDLSIALNPIRVLPSFFPKQIRESIQGQDKKDWIKEKIEEKSYPAQYFQFNNNGKEFNKPIQDILITARIRKFPKAGLGLYEVFIIAEITDEAEWDWIIAGSTSKKYDDPNKHDENINDLFIHIARQFMQNIKNKGLA